MKWTAVNAVGSTVSVRSFARATDPISLFRRWSLYSFDIKNIQHRTIGHTPARALCALGLKAVLLATTLFGVTSLWMAILADTGATVLVTANALRLLRVGLDSAGAPSGTT